MRNFEFGKSFSSFGYVFFSGLFISTSKDLPVIKVRTNQIFPLISENSLFTEMRAKQSFPTHFHDLPVIKVKGGKKYEK